MIQSEKFAVQSAVTAPGRGFRLTIEPESHGALGRLAGPLDIRHVLEAKAQLVEAVQQHTRLRLHLSAVSSFDAAGLQLLVLCKREAVRLNHQLELTDHSQAVVEQFQLYDIANYFGDPLILTGAGPARAAG